MRRAVAVVLAAVVLSPSGSIAAEPPKDIVGVATSSPDFSTLVKALEAAELVRSLQNAGPFTVFAPTNAAFAKLPQGTLERLMKPENKAELADILKYHVTVPPLDVSTFKDGQTLGMSNGKKVSFKMVNGKITVNGANISSSVRATNGIIHVIDAVLLPPAK